MEFLKTYKIYIIVFVIIAIVATGLGVGLTLGLKEKKNDIEELKEEIPEVYWKKNMFEILPAKVQENKIEPYLNGGPGIIAGIYIQTDPNYPIWTNLNILPEGGYWFEEEDETKLPWDPGYPGGYAWPTGSPYVLFNKNGSGLAYLETFPYYYFTVIRDTKLQQIKDAIDKRRQDWGTWGLSRTNWQYVFSAPSSTMGGIIHLPYNLDNFE